MNWIVVYDNELNSDGLAQIDGERHTHIKSILKKGIGDTIQVVIPNSGNFLFYIQSTTEKTTVIQKGNTIPDVLNPLRIQTFFSLPRPQTAKKLLHLAGAYGVETLYFYTTETKNKEYWTSPVYHKDTVSYLETGLSQTGNSRLPSLVMEKTLSWKQFLKSWKGNVLILDREGREFILPLTELKNTAKDLLFVFGPESGWKTDDILFFQESGFLMMSLGKINLRTEFAYSALLHQLFKS